MRSGINRKGDGYRGCPPPPNLSQAWIWVIISSSSLIQPIDSHQHHCWCPKWAWFNEKWVWKNFRAQLYPVPPPPSILHFFLHYWMWILIFTQGVKGCSWLHGIDSVRQCLIYKQTKLHTDLNNLQMFVLDCTTYTGQSCLNLGKNMITAQCWWSAYWAFHSGGFPDCWSGNMLMLSSTTTFSSPTQTLW